MNRLFPLSRWLPPLLILVGPSGVDAQQVNPNIGMGPPCGIQPQLPQITFAAKPGDTVGPNSNPQLNAEISATDVGTVFWELAAQAGCSGNIEQIECAGAPPIFRIVAPPGAVSPTTSAGRVRITNIRPIAAADDPSQGVFSVQATDADDTNIVCTWQYKVHVTGNGGGWGDPHITTVDGVAYDFQSAGEFTALRQKALEIQTRQKAVPTAAIPNANPYTGLATCVSIYSAVAARIGSNRVSLQPNLSGEPDPSGLELRVNGKLVTLTDSGIDLRADGSTEPSAQLEGRITKAAGGAYEFTDAHGTQLVATPAYWDSQQTWYLNLNVYQTSATQGIWGRLADDSWLPALPDGTSLGSKPTALDQRYQDLYVKFADAWRVTDATSLFDYASGTNTATFTDSDWPRFNPESCLIEGQTPAEPTDPESAAQACSGITDPAQKADCIFDVTVTGHTGFAEAYGTMQAFRPHGTGWQLALAGVDVTPPPPPSPWPWWWWALIVILVLIVLAVLISRKKKTT